MCTGLEPMALAGMAANVGGALLNNRIQNQTISEQNRQNQIAMTREREARDAETTRQTGWEAEQAASAMAALTQADPTQVAQRSREAVEAPDNVVARQADDYNVPTLQGQTSNEDVDASIGRQIAGQTDRTRQMLRSAAMLQAQGGQMNDVAQALFGMGSQVQNVGSNRRGSMNAAQMETNIPAATVRPSNSILGDLLMMGGSAMAGRAGQGMGLGSQLMPGQGRMPLNSTPFLGPLVRR